MPKKCTPDGTRPEYVAWMAMCRRCHNPNTLDYPDYGGRGIKVCDRWLNNGEYGRGFANFFADMGHKPTPKHTLDRIDTDGLYSPDNCKWADKFEQANNKRNIKKYTVLGVTGGVAFLSRHFGISRERVKNRIKRGWSLEKAFTMPATNRWDGIDKS